MNRNIHQSSRKTPAIHVLIFALTLSMASIASIQAQPFFPIKVEKKWGLINSDGDIVLDPDYDAIGEFQQFGYAVMQREGKVGMLNVNGEEVIEPAFEDLKVLDSTLVAVMDQGQWMVINLRGDILLEKGYERVQVWNGFYLAYQKEGKWGLTNKFGHQLATPKYNEIQYEKGNFFITNLQNRLGLLSSTGREILPNKAEEIRFYNDSLYFYREGRSWGAVDFYGIDVIEAAYQTFSRISDQYIKLSNEKGHFVYSTACSRIFRNSQYDDYYSFSPRYIIAKKNRQLGLLDWCGNIVLPVAYDEIQAYNDQLFRANLHGKWGVVQSGGELLIPFEYDYIAPLKNKICIVKKEGRFGICNFQGKEVVQPQYHKIHIENNTVKAYTIDQMSQSGEKLTLLHFDQQGELQDANNFSNHFQVRIAGKEKPNNIAVGTTNDYLLEHFEWFYSPSEDRWGLRKLEDGSIQIPATFSSVHVERQLGFTLVGIPKAKEYTFDRTNFRFDALLGLVSNDLGKLVTELDFWDIKLEDFHKGAPLARVTFSNGRQGLIDRIGKVVKKDMAYVGNFVNGVARFSFTGKLSGSKHTTEHSLGKLRSYLNSLTVPSIMLDYTQHDQQFQREASLICKGCEWGYIDTSGQVIVPPQYTFVKDFINNVGIVECSGKWGMVNQNAKVVIPCNYDGVQFLENTNNTIVRVYIKEPKYGLIDTLGQLAVSAIYDEIGSFNEGRLAVKRNGMWGFVDHNGFEIIPCRFREVQNFSEGMAAARLGSGWGFIDNQGDVEIDFTYKKAGNFRHQISWVQTDKGCGYLDKEGDFVIPPRFDKAFDFQWGVARVVQDGDFGLINLSGAYVMRPRYAEINAYNEYQLAVARHRNANVSYGLIDVNGEMITKLPLKSIQEFREGLAVARYRDEYGYIDTTGRLVIPAIYSKAASFSEGLAAVQKNGDCGYINSRGDVTIPFEYSKCLDFKDGRAVVYKGMRKAGLINHQGEQLIAPSLDRLLNFQEGRGLVRDEKYRFYYITEEASLYDGYYQRASEFKHGVAVVQVNGKWGIINQKGIEIIPPKYDQIESFEDGYAKVRIHGFNGLASLDGDLIIKPDYEYISYAGEGLFRVEKGDRLGYFDIEGNWVWAMTR